ncbi:peptidase M42 [Kosmotoga arenicorallina S304]|uniref:Peptidase M42 n=1 Tax=Kosmotoga arenicorallina S304 TaxID=1453497 RepID=A0A176K4D5_9BACT|nr:M42 family metallopeptidase [Kosmotoga arenicorallina]OAA31932.1 peptidase M42 [Kosmotoga arenicorallina S304]
MKITELLRDLSNSFGPVGYEDETRQLIHERISPFVDEVNIDSMGNLIALKKGNTGKRVAIFTHMDEISLVISKTDERGFARFEGLGGIDPKVLISQKVRIKCRDGVERRGVIGMLAPHLQDKKSKGKVPGFDELFIDISMNSDYEAVQPGDLVVVDFKALELNGKVIGKALDDRACCAVSILTAKELEKFTLRPDVYFVFTSREEIGVFGAKVAAEGIRPDLGIAMDVTHDNSEFDISIGKGPAISVGGPNIDKKYFDKLDKTAKKHNIPVQYEFAAGRTGTDADMVQISGTGIPTLLMSLPQMYMHTPVEVIDTKDVENSVRLLVEFLSELEEGEKDEV